MAAQEEERFLVGCVENVLRFCNLVVSKRVIFNK